MAINVAAAGDRQNDVRPDMVLGRPIRCWSPTTGTRRRLQASACANSRALTRPFPQAGEQAGVSPGTKSAKALLNGSRLAGDDPRPRNRQNPASTSWSGPKTTIWSRARQDHCSISAFDDPRLSKVPAGRQKTLRRFRLSATPL